MTSYSWLVEMANFAQPSITSSLVGNAEIFTDINIFWKHSTSQVSREHLTFLFTRFKKEGEQSGGINEKDIESPLGKNLDLKMAKPNLLVPRNLNLMHN